MDRRGILAKRVLTHPAVRAIGILAILAGTLTAMAQSASAAMTTTAGFARMAGADRYATAAAVAKAAFPAGASVAVVATGVSFPDALAADYLAGQVGGPVLLTQPSVLPAVTAAELTTLGVSTVYLVGGTGAVSAQVATAIGALHAPSGASLTVVRIAGADRYATAAAVAEAVSPAQVGSIGGARTALLATGTGFADALAGSAAAAGARLPLLLTSPTGLSAALLPTLQFLGVTSVVILGGAGAVSSSVATTLTAAGVSVSRLGGADRVATATLVASWELTALGFTGTDVAVARGDNAGSGVDALALGVLAGLDQEPLLLTASPTSLGAALGTWLAADTGLVGGTVAGGTGAISDALMTLLGTYAPVAIGTTALHDGFAGLRYTQQLVASSGLPPFTWAATGLPAGLSLSADGVLFGTPATTGASSVSLTVTDARTASSTATLSLSVPQGLPSGCIGTSCALLTPDGQTVQIPAGDVLRVVRSASTGKVTQVVVTGVTPVAGQVMVVAPISAIPSGLIAVADTATAGAGGTTTVTVTPATPAEAYAEGTVNVVGPLITPASIAPQTISTLAGAALTCTAGVSSSLHGLTVTPSLTPSVAALWQHPVFGGGGIYVGSGGLSLFQFDLDGSVTVNLGVAVSGAATCTLTLPAVRAAVPAGDLGAVILEVVPILTLHVTGRVDVNTSVTLNCGTEYRWDKGQEYRSSYCGKSFTPLQLTAASGLDATLSGALDASVTLDDIAGITGTITDALHAGYHPASHPTAEIDTKADYELGACLACIWKGSPLKVTIATGTLFDAVLATYDTPSPTAPPTNPVDQVGFSWITPPQWTCTSSGTGPFTATIAVNSTLTSGHILLWWSLANPSGWGLPPVFFLGFFPGSTGTYSYAGSPAQSTSCSPGLKLQLVGVGYCPSGTLAQCELATIPPRAPRKSEEATFIVQGG